MANKVNEISGKTADKKMNLMYKAWNLQGEELGKFLRENGIYSEDLRIWKDQMKDGLERQVKMTGSARREYRDQVKQLKEELAQANAVIEFQKKVLILKQEEAESITRKPVRK